MFLDLDNDDFSLDLPAKLDGVLFFQGINPVKNTRAMDIKHFNNMLRVNLIGPAMLIKSIVDSFNDDAMVLFFTSVAARKGSYDPSYASAKAGIIGMMYSFANEFPKYRFNALSLGLVENSRVHEQMTPAFREKHALGMYKNSLIKFSSINSMIFELLENSNINRSVIPIDGGLIL